MGTALLLCLSLAPIHSAMDQAEAAGKAIAALHMLIGFQSPFPAPPGHVLDQFLFASSQIGFSVRRALDLAERVGNEPVPAEVRVGIDPSSFQGGLPVVVPKEPGCHGRAP